MWWLVHEVINGTFVRRFQWKKVADFIRQTVKEEWEEEFEDFEPFITDDGFDIDAIEQSNQEFDDKALEVARLISGFDSDVIYNAESTHIPYVYLRNFDVNLLDESVEW